MGKPKHPRVLADTEAKAIATNIRVSPQKLNLVAQMIRGKKVQAAIADLEFSRKRIAIDVRKCVISAVANAENNHNLSADNLFVVEARADEGPTAKRWQPRAQGRSFAIHKPMTHITVVVQDREA